MESSNGLKIFENPEFGEIRVIEKDGDPWFVGKDLVEIMGYQNGSRDINRHVDELDRRKDMIFDGQQKKETIIINESGLYALILSSKLPTAKKFKRWVTSEVLPAIRRTGGYIPVEEEDDEMTILSKAVLISQKTIEQKDKIISELRENNRALACEVLQWDDRASINKAVRLIAHTRGTKFQYVWKELYDELLYKHGIGLKHRGKAPYIQYVQEDEWSKVVQCLSAICEKSGVSYSYIAERAKLDSAS